MAIAAASAKDILCHGVKGLMSASPNLKRDEDLRSEFVENVKFRAVKCESPQSLILVANAIGCDDGEAVAKDAGETDV